MMALGACYRNQTLSVLARQAARTEARCTSTMRWAGQHKLRSRMVRSFKPPTINQVRTPLECASPEPMKLGGCVNLALMGSHDLLRWMNLGLVQARLLQAVVRQPS